jgi:hypothetical protein
MKKILILLTVLFATNLYGQFNTESIYFSGMTNFSTGLEITSSDFEGGGFIPFNLKVEGGYFIKNKLAIGGILAIEDLNIPLWGTSENYDYEIHLGPTVRYYIPQEENWHTYLFGYAFYGLEYGHNFYGLQFGPGANYFFNESISLDARISYTYKHTFNREFGGSHNNHRFLFEIGITVFFPSIKFFDRS